MNAADNVRNWTLKTDDEDIAWLGLRMSGSTNVLSNQVMQELDTVVSALYTAPPAGLVVYSHKESGFIAGADVKEFPLMLDEQSAMEKILAGQNILERFEALPFTTVAVLNGTTLGGGLEFALACDWRIGFASDKPVFGLPEVQLGVHPGLGGTVRAVELMGVRAAMELMLTGKPIRPAKALAQGLLDRITSAETWRSEASELALQARPPRKQPLLDRLLGLAPFRPLLASQLTKQVARKARVAHYPAPFAIINLWRKHAGKRDSFADEARSFAKLVFSPTSRNLVRVFFLQDRLKSMAKASSRHFAHVHVVGAGTMGADIAAWCALRGLSVTLQDREKQYVDAGLERARKSLQRKLRDTARVDSAAARLVGDHTGEGARTADVIIEAIFEDLSAKQALFSNLEKRARPEAMLASNTSSIPLEQIATAMQNPSRLIGLHFFNPVALMPLVEVVNGADTAPGEITDGAAFVKQIGKLPLPCKGLPGFLVNRVLAPYMDEAFRLYEEGCQPEAIDKAATDFGMPVGPIELADSVGLDILKHVGEIVGPTIGREPQPGISKLVEQQKLGEKSGQGFYEWSDGKPKKQPVESALPEDAQDRLILSFVNEAVACIADEVVSDADLADAGMIFGSGFAPFRGGPLAYATTTGSVDMQKRLRHLAAAHGSRFEPSPGWEKLVDQPD
jgi:3-hydroxyacyl-CoA dehydrogenase/enoyl-CoA hydratase/3-hydroxybutyryl-CoA epimerase